MGLSAYRNVFAVNSLLAFTGTVVLSFYGPANPLRKAGVLRTIGCALLGITVGVFLFVLP